MTQAFNLSQLANNLDSSGRLDATDGLVNAVPIANGGTGASSVAAAVSNLSASIYPVGSIYINAGVTTNPATLLGFGTWTAFGAGRVLVGLNAADSAFDTLQETGGSKDAIVVSHTHTATVTDPGHTHTADGVLQLRGVGGGFDWGAGTSDTRTTNSNTTGITVANSTTGSSGTNANLQPYITVCMWLRTA
jgi:hypothetical protein